MSASEQNKKDCQMSESVNIVIGGDFCPQQGSIPFDPISDDLKGVFGASDYSILNLETPLTMKGIPIEKTGRNFRNNPQYASILAEAGVKCVSLANNHIRDFGDLGVIETISACRSAGLDYVGAGKDRIEASKALIRVINGFRVAIINFCEEEFNAASTSEAGAYIFDTIEAYKEISILKSSVDFIIAIYHGGIEYVQYPTLEMIKIFRFLVDIGIDAVVGHHAHVYLGYEIYKEKPIVYGVGNFYSHPKGVKKESWFNGLLAKINLSEEGTELTLIPIWNDSVNRQVKLSPISSDVLSDLEKISSKLNEIVSLKRIWDEHYSCYSKSFYILLRISSRIGLSVFKRIPFDVCKPFRVKRLMWLNILRCNSHRNRAIEILKRSLS